MEENRKMRIRALSDSEAETLAALDHACWEDGESGGDGWANVSKIVRLRGRSEALVRRHLFFCRHFGLVETREDESAYRYGVFVYAPTEQGAEYLQRIEQRPPEAGHGCH